MTSNEGKTMNAAPGFPCPLCGRVNIKVTLESFLNAKEVRCPSCGGTFFMDKSQCTRMVELLQDLYVATENAKAVKKPKL